MTGFVFVIEGESEESPPAVFTVEGDDSNLEAAVRLVHARLVQLAPQKWSDDWRDLLDDVQEGVHQVWGPVEIAHLG